MCLIILDANVVIDFRDSDRTVLKLFSREIEELGIPAGVLIKVNEFTKEDCEELGIKVLYPDSMELSLITTSGSLASDDQECVILAKERGMKACTNDKPLRNKCEEINVDVLWGLELLLKLVEKKKLTEEKAITVAESIKDSNPYITEEILTNFRNKLGCL